MMIDDDDEIQPILIDSFIVSALQALEELGPPITAGHVNAFRKFLAEVAFVRAKRLLSSLSYGMMTLSLPGSKSASN